MMKINNYYNWCHEVLSNYNPLADCNDHLARAYIVILCAAVVNKSHSAEIACFDYLRCSSEYSSSSTVADLRTLARSSVLSFEQYSKCRIKNVPGSYSLRKSGNREILLVQSHLYRKLFTSVLCRCRRRP